MQSLSAAQATAVRAAGHVAITACPGSGKTTTLAARADRLLQTARHRVGCATFSSEAAAEIEERIRRRMPNVGSRLVCGTFHALAAQQLRARGHRKHILSQRERFNAVAGIRNDLWPPTPRSGGSRPSVADCITIIEHYKSRLPGEPVPPLPELAHEDCELLLEAYAERLAKLGAGDFHDIMRDAVVHMRAGRIAPMELTHLLVDEFQDTDPAQAAWIDCHAQAGTEVTVVGDDDQSIYGWRNAQGYDGFKSFMDAYAAQHVPLDQSYRCPAAILALAGRLIAHNSARVPKALQSCVSTAGKVLLLPAASDARCLDALASALRAHPDDPQRWAVLARTNRQLDEIETKLSGQIAYRRIGGRSILDMRDPALMLSVCSSLANGTVVGFSDLLSRSGVDPDHMPGGNGAQALEAFINTSPQLGGKAGENYEIIRASARGWRDLIKEERVGIVLEDIEALVCRLIDESNAPPEAKATSVKVVEGLRLRLSELKGPLASRLRKISEERRETRDARVTLCTLHASKGLEWDHVWIVGCDTGRLPHTGADVDEERRLLYVGMTRAKSELRMSYNEGLPSPFLAEMGI